MRSKKILFISLVIMFSACQRNTEDRESIRKQIAEYRLQAEELNKKIELLEKQLDSIPSMGEEGYKVAVRVMQVESGNFKHFIEVGGVVEAINQALISPELNGQIKRILVSEGDRVTRGQFLAEINSDVTQSQIEQVQSSLDYANVVYEKQKRLWDQKIGSEIQYLDAKNRVENLENQLNVLNTQLEMARITSPVNGVVDEIYKKDGELAVPGQPLMQVVNLDQVYINADVSETYLSSIRVGESVEVQFPAYPELKLVAPIHRKGNIINPNNRTFTVQLKMPNPEKMLKPNILARIYINDFSADNALVVPSSLVKQDLSGSYVYVVEDREGKMMARKAYIETGLSHGNQTMVTDGIEPGQRVIVSGYNQVSDGSMVEIQSDDVS